MTVTTDQNRQELDKANIIRYDGIDAVVNLKEDFWNENQVLCAVDEMRRIATIPDLPVTINVIFNCQELFDFPRFGTATFILLFYALRLEALADGNMHLYIYGVVMPMRKKINVIYPWLLVK